jgi:site-specific recombinase XerC
METCTYRTHDIRCKGRSTLGKIRKLQFSEEAMEALKKWLEVRGDDDCPYMFVIKNDKECKQRNKENFNYWCSTLFTKIVGRRVHPHLFRESRATNLVVHSGRTLESAQKLLGHQSVETTKIYVIRDDTDDSDEAFV